MPSSPRIPVRRRPVEGRHALELVAVGPRSTASGDQKPDGMITDERGVRSALASVQRMGPLRYEV
jgi:hypothetical protein